MIKGVMTTPLDVIDTPGGSVLHAMKSSSEGFLGFGEAYFSTIDFKAIKGWKRHTEMTLNLIVPIGAVRFILYDDTVEGNSAKRFQEVILSRSENYVRLTIPPMIWLGFQGLDQHTNILLNIADIEHSPNEVDRKNLNEVKFNWN